MDGPGEEEDSESSPLLGSDRTLERQFAIYPRITTVNVRRLSVQLVFCASPSDITGEQDSTLFLSGTLFNKRQPVAAAPKVPLHFHSNRHRRLEGVVDMVLTDPQTGFRCIFFTNSEPMLERPYSLMVHPYVLGPEPESIFQTGQNVSVLFNPETWEVVSFPRIASHAQKIVTSTPQ